MSLNIYSGISPLNSYDLSTIPQLKSAEVKELRQKYDGKVSGARIINFLYRIYQDVIPENKAFLTLDQVKEKLSLTFHQVWNHLIKKGENHFFPIAKLHEVELEQFEYNLDDTVLTNYFRKIKKIELLTNDAELDLAMQIEQGSEEANMHMVSSNLRLVAKIASNYINRGVSLDDLIQEGNIGLIKSIPKFDYTLGNKFSTYSTWWIKKAITRSISNSGMVRIPVYIKDFQWKYKKFIQTFEIEHKRLPSDKEVSLELGVGVDKIELIKELKEVTSLDSLFEEDAESLIPDKVVDIEEVVESNEKEFKVKTVLNEILNQREVFILTNKYGLGGILEKSNNKLGKKLGITRERVRQIHDGAILKLQEDPLTVKLLQDFYE